MPRHFFLDRKDRIFRHKERVLPPFSWRDDPAVPAFPDDRVLLVIDGVCPFCTTGAERLARADRDDRLRLTTVQRPLGAALMRHFGLDPEAPETWLVLSGGRAYGGLAAYGVAGREIHGWTARLARLAGALPDGLAGPAYRLLARNRHRLPGRQRLCGLPSPAIAARLL